MTKTYSKKLIISGKKAELYYYEEAIKINKKMKKRKNYKKRTKEEIIEEVKKCDKAEFKMEVIRDFSLRRTRSKIVRLIDCNPDLNTFLTLTFKDNVCDLKRANLVFNKFIKRLKRQVPGLKYLAVPEFQKRGAVHYHVLVNFEMENKRLADIWGNGFVMINKVKHVNRIGAYVAKYISKDLFDLRYFGMRKIFSSRNLAKPIVVIIRSEIREFFLKIQKTMKILSEKAYFSDWLGRIDYRLYGY
jgi:hypothetical protein